MKVAYITKNWSRGGNLLPIIKAMPNSVQTDVFYGKSDLETLWIPRKRKKALKQYDVLHINGTLYGGFMPNDFKNIVVTVHTLAKSEYEFDRWKYWKGVLAEQRTIKTNQHRNVEYLCVSPFIEWDLHRHYPETEYCSTAIPHALCDSQFRGADWLDKHDESEINIVTSGRLIKRKNFGDFLKIAKEYDHQRNYKFHIIGDGVERGKLEKQAGKNVIFYGDLREDIYQSFLQNSVTCYVSTSLYEGDPQNIVDMMTIGVPVLAYPIPSMKDMIFDGATGYCFCTAKEFGEKLTELLTTSDMYQFIVENAREEVSHRPTAEQIAKQFLEVYEELV